MFNFLEEIFNHQKSVKLFRWTSSFLFLLLTLFSAFYLSKLSTSYSLSQFFPKNHEILKQQKETAAFFQIEERTPFLLLIHQEESWLNKKSFQKIVKMVEKIKSLKKVKNVQSLATIESAIFSDKSISVGPVFENLTVDRWEDYIKKNELLYEQLISKDFKTLLIVVEPNDISTQQRKNLKENLLYLAEKAFPKNQIELGGSPAIQIRLNEILKKDLIQFSFLCLALFSFLFFILIRGGKALLITLFSMTFSNIVCLGVLSALKIPIDVLISTLPVIVSVAVLSVMIHTFHRWSEALHQMHPLFNKNILTYKIIKEMSLANFLGSMTTAFGFLALILTSIPAIKNYGWVIAGSILLSWFLSQWILLAYIGLSKTELRQWAKEKSFWTLKVLKHSRFIISISVLGLILGAFSISKLNFSSRLFNDLAQNDPARMITSNIDDKFGGIINYDLTLYSDAENHWKKIENIKILNALVQSWKSHEDIGSIHSFNSFIDFDQTEKSSQISELAFMFSMSPENPLKHYVTDDGKSLRISFRFHDVPSQQIQLKMKTISDQLKTNFPNVEIKNSGIGYLNHLLNEEVSKDLVMGFWESLLIIGLFLIFVLRSFKLSILACLPNILPPFLIISFMALSQVPIKPGLAIIFSIALGLAFNNTVYILTRLKSLLPKYKYFRNALKSTLLQEGNPCLFETIIMLGGFTLFLFSGFEINRIFGSYMVLSILFGAFGDLIFLPSLLHFTGEKIFRMNMKNQIGTDMNNLDNKTSQKILSSDLHRNKVSGYIVIIFSFLLLISQNSWAAPIKTESKKDEKHLLAQVKKSIQVEDEKSEIEMQILEKGGEIKKRSLKLKNIFGEKFSSLVTLTSPADIKGTSLLVEIENKQESQWLYTPSSKQVRRLMSTKKGSNVLGSELSIDDLDPGAIKTLSVKILQKDKKITLLSLKPQLGTSPYDEVHITISNEHSIPLKTEYYKNRKIVKYVKFENYKKYGAIYRPHKIEIRNAQNQRGTILIVKKTEINKGLKSSEFTPQKLKEGI